MTPRYRLRTLLILLAVLPPLLWFGCTKYEAWKAEQKRLKTQEVWLDSRLGPLPMAIDFAFPTSQPPLVGNPPQKPVADPVPVAAPDEPAQ